MPDWNTALFEGEPFDTLLKKHSGALTQQEKVTLLAALDTPERLEELAKGFAAKGEGVPETIDKALAKAANLGDFPMDRDPDAEERGVIDAANAFYSRMMARAKEMDKAQDKARRFHSMENENTPPVMPWARLKKAVEGGERSLGTAIDLYRHAKKEGVVMEVEQDGEPLVLDMTGPATLQIRKQIIDAPGTVIEAVEAKRHARGAQAQEP